LALITTTKATSGSVARRPNLSLYQRRADHAVQGYGCRQLFDKSHCFDAHPHHLAHQPHDVLRVVRAVGIAGDAAAAVLEGAAQQVAARTRLDDVKLGVALSTLSVAPSTDATVTINGAPVGS
jgi:hypothetical protein